MTKKDYLIIDRSKWRTGNYSDIKTGFGDTMLLNRQGYMCCLGFRCHQMGIPEEDLLNKSYPLDLSDKWDIPDLLEKFNHEYLNSDFTFEAATINDAVYLSPKEREKDIKAHFKTIGVIVEFTGKYE